MSGSTDRNATGGALSPPTAMTSTESGTTTMRPKVMILMIWCGRELQESQAHEVPTPDVSAADSRPGPTHGPGGQYAGDQAVTGTFLWNVEFKTS